MSERLEQVIAHLYPETGRNKEFAKLIGVTPQKISAYTSGVNLPNGETLQKIARVGINVHWLLTGEGEMLINNEFDPDSSGSSSDQSTQLSEIHRKLDQLLRNNYVGRAAAGRLPEDEE